MKYEIKSDDPKDSDSFEILKLEIVKEKTRARIATWTVGAWLLILLGAGARAAISGQHNDLQAILIVLTPLAAMALRWYLGKEHRK